MKVWVCGWGEIGVKDKGLFLGFNVLGDCIGCGEIGWLLGVGEKVGVVDFEFLREINILVVFVLLNFWGCFGLKLVILFFRVEFLDYFICLFFLNCCMFFFMFFCFFIDKWRE